MIQKNSELLAATESFSACEPFCPACGSSHLTDFFEIEALPVHVGVLWDTPQQARNAPMGKVTLSCCKGCGFVYNRDFQEEKIWFEPGYEVALSHSEMFREFTQNVANRLIQRYDLRGQRAIEIGCGDGYFLQLLAEIGGVHGIGFDKSVPRLGRQEVGQGSVEFIRDYYSSQYADLQADFICCLSVFEDIPQPQQFLLDLRKTIGPRPMNLYFEIFNAHRAIQQQETWSIHYEQCNYFGLNCFKSLFETCGFNVLETGGCYGNDQYIFIEAAARPSWQPIDFSPPSQSRELPTEVAEFAAIHQRKITTWTQRLKQFQGEGKRVVAWGSGGKGISFLNAVPTVGCIEYVVDINPDRQGKYLPGSAQKVVAPQFLESYKPDIVILTNVLYRDEIRQQLAELGVECEFHIA